MRRAEQLSQLFSIARSLVRVNACLCLEPVESALVPTRVRDEFFALQLAIPGRRSRSSQRQPQLSRPISSDQSSAHRKNELRAESIDAARNPGPGSKE